MQNPRSDCTSENLPAPDHWSVKAAAEWEARILEDAIEASRIFHEERRAKRAREAQK